MPKRKIDLLALRKVAEAIAASGRVVNAKALAELVGVPTSTITRNLRKLDIALPTEGRDGRYQRSGDEESRSHEEIVRLIRQAIACEPKKHPHTDVDLISVLGLKTKERNMRKIRAGAGISSAPQRRRNYLLESKEGYLTVAVEDEDDDEDMDFCDIYEKSWESIQRRGPETEVEPELTPAYLGSLLEAEMEKQKGR
jgi:hypothetical protein